MAPHVRLATAKDAAAWLDILKLCVGLEYPAREVYEPQWIERQLLAETGHETWIAELDGQIHACIAFLTPANSGNPVGNLGRFLTRPESYSNGCAHALLQHITRLSAERKQMLVTRVPASDNIQQYLWENLGYVCVGFQPFKHIFPTREGILFYVRPASKILNTRTPLSDSMPQVSALAAVVLDNLKLPSPVTIRDGATGYPLPTDLKFVDGTFEDFELWRSHLEADRAAIEVSTGYNRGLGLLRVVSDTPIRCLLAQRESQTVGGLAYLYDEHDRCVRILDAFSADGISSGALFRLLARQAHEMFSVAYLEVDILMTAPQLLKCAEQLGFVPIAYFPAFYSQAGHFTDIVKLVKLNLAYTTDRINLTPHASNIVNVVNQYFENPKLGIVALDLVRKVPLFDGLGEGELRKVARLFSQKLYRPGEQIFEKDEHGEEIYVIMRGQVEIAG